jgi:hypothetical protein
MLELETNPTNGGGHMKRLYTNKELFGAFDLHSNNNHLAIIDGEDNRPFNG